MTRLALVEALTAMTLVQKGISTQFEADGQTYDVPVQAAYRTTPASSDSIIAPCFMNFWRLDGLSRNPGEWREDRYTLTVQCLAADAGGNAEVKGLIATALWEEFLAAFDKNLAFGQEGAYAFEIRGRQDTMPAIFEWNGKGYIGWECEVALTIVQQSDFGLGVR